MIPERWRVVVVDQHERVVRSVRRPFATEQEAREFVARLVESHRARDSRPPDYRVILTPER